MHGIVQTIKNQYINQTPIPILMDSNPLDMNKGHSTNLTDNQRQILQKKMEPKPRKRKYRSWITSHIPRPPRQ